MIAIDKSKVQQAFVALEAALTHIPASDKHGIWFTQNAIASLRQTIATTEESSVVQNQGKQGVVSWNSLTESEAERCVGSNWSVPTWCVKDIARNAEAMLKQKNAQLPPERVHADVEALRHSANEWADMAVNGLQWVRNIAQGISTAQDALTNLESNLAHCREVNDGPDVQAFVRAAQPKLEPISDEQRIQMWHKAKPAHLSWASFDWYSQGVADAENAHGIKGEA